MADVVQFKLERMLDEFDDLERRGIFTRTEIAEIVKRRRNFEYRLKRPSPLKQDILAYIDYEKNVESLRLLRYKSSAKNSSGKKGKKSVSDYAGLSRILEIYQIATTRFKGDIELWFQYLEFCRSRRSGRMKKVLAQLVRFHPKVPGVWIYAAAWEFDHNLNVTAARALMQNGLRSCPTSEDLWVEYIRMELTYLNKLQARKAALQGDKVTLDLNQQNAEDKQWREDNEDLFMSLNEPEGETEKHVSHDGESDAKLTVLKEHGMKILETVYSAAIEALPYSFNLRTRFLEIVEAVDLTHSEDIRTKILDDMKRDFSKEPHYWDWLARLKIEAGRGIKPEQLGMAIQVYEEGLDFLPSPTIFSNYVKFLMDVINNEMDEETTIHFNFEGRTIDLISHLLMVFEKAYSLDCMTGDLACQHVSFLMKLGRSDEAKELIQMLCSEKFSNSVRVWTLCLSLEMSKTDQSSTFKLLRNVLKKFGISEAKDIWLMGLKHYSNKRKYFDKLLNIAVSSLTRDGGSDDGFCLSSTIVDYILQRDGIDSARDMYKRFLALPRPGLALCRKCVELELNLNPKPDLSNARKLFEMALAIHDQDATLWQDYYSMEAKIGTSESAAAIHWRSRKVLKNNIALTHS